MFFKWASHTHTHTNHVLPVCLPILSIFIFFSPAQRFLFHVVLYHAHSQNCKKKMEKMEKKTKGEHIVM